MPASRSGERGSASASAAGRRPGERGHDRRAQRAGDGGRAASRRRPPPRPRRAPRSARIAARARSHEQGAAQHSPQDRLHERGSRGATDETPSAMTPLRASRSPLLALLRPRRSGRAPSRRSEWYNDTGAGGALAQPPSRAPERRQRGARRRRASAESPPRPATTPSQPGAVARAAQAEPVLGAPERGVPRRSRRDRRPQRPHSRRRQTARRRGPTAATRSTARCPSPAASSPPWPARACCCSRPARRCARGARCARARRDFARMRTSTGALPANSRASSSVPMCSPQCIGTATRGWMRRAASAASCAVIT